MCSANPPSRSVWVENLRCECFKWEASEAYFTLTGVVFGLLQKLSRKLVHITSGTLFIMSWVLYRCACHLRLLQLPVLSFCCFAVCNDNQSSCTCAVLNISTSRVLRSFITSRNLRLEGSRAEADNHTMSFSNDSKDQIILWNDNKPANSNIGEGNRSKTLKLQIVQTCRQIKFHRQ
jgi:hypothetical protein